MVCRRRGSTATLRRAGRDGAGVWYLGSGPGRGLWWCAEGTCAARVTTTHVRRAVRREVDRSDLTALERLGVGPESGLWKNR